MLDVAGSHRETVEDPDLAVCHSVSVEVPAIPEIRWFTDEEMADLRRGQDRYFKFLGRTGYA